jgi:DNA repair photolyase
MNRIRAGYARYKHPFGGKVYEVSLKPEDVIVLVFWSRNYGPLLPYLPHLDQLGYGGYFHFTITGFGKPLEPHAPSIQDMIDSFKSLADRSSPKHVLWRFDPIILSNNTSNDYIIERFESLARQLRGYTERCYTSFVDFYHKTERNLQILAEQGFHFYDPETEEKLALTRQFVEIGKEYGIRLYACCESELLEVPGITQAHCVDALLIRELFPDKFQTLKKTPTRKGCGCFASRDIGAYDTCIFGCLYCYANSSHQKALANYIRHNPESPIL